MQLFKIILKKKCAKKIKLLLALLLLTVGAAAQIGGFERGYIVGMAGDTLLGKVKFGTQAQRACKAYFRQDSSKEVIKFRPFDIKTYYALGDSYDSKLYRPDPEAETFGAFMRRLEVGFVSLYEFWNTDGERGFTQTFLEEDGGKVTEVNYLNFKKQLTKFFIDYPQLSAKIERGAFRKEDLPAIVREYNDWRTTQEGIKKTRF